MTTRTIRRASLLLVLLALSACASGQTRERGGYQAAERASVLVNNQAWQDFNIYLVRNGTQRIRLGLVNAQSRATFQLPSTVVGTGTLVRFLADPVSGNVAPSSFELTVRGDQQLRLTIPYRSY